MRKHGCLVGYGVERIGVNDAAGAFEDEAVELGVLGLVDLLVLQEVVQHGGDPGKRPGMVQHL